MGLVDRLYGTGDDKIPVHQFMAAMGELERSQATRQNIVDAFNLSVDDQVELDALIAKAILIPAAERFKYARELHDVLLLGEGGFRYTTKAALRTRLGI